MEDKYCNRCAFKDTKCGDISNIKGYCSVRNRSVKKSVIFKKLEKVGEPFTVAGILYQHYKVFDIDNVCGDGFWCVHNYKAKTLTIEIKLNKEDMEEKKIQHYDCFFDKEQSKPNLKPFSLELAKQGKPVCTRDGHKARVICFDRKFYHDGYNYPIVAMVNDNDNELVHAYTQDGLLVGNAERELDLMMLPEKRSGWAKVRKDINLYDTKEEALNRRSEFRGYIDTVNVSWEE